MASKRPGLTWTADPAVLANKLGRATQKAHVYLSKTTEYYSLRADTYAKGKAPWTDRSGNARSGLSTLYRGELSKTSARFEIDVFHRVPYGIWLELKYNGKWSIINRTISVEGRRYFKAANAVMARMFGGS